MLIVLFCALTLAWMALIYWFSANNGRESGEFSGNILRKLLCVCYPGWSSKTALQKEAVIGRFHTFFRKCGHFSEYAVLGVFCRITWALIVSCMQKSRQRHSARDFLLPALLSFLYACSDEYHQRFVAGRSGEFRDVLIDFSGACLGIAVVSLILCLLNRKPEYET
ncbi:MAG: VanZ family protein [Oscillospiraceae bacterium]|nr:VanZ family protein [Oscillospiraceae bacterium]